jgi:hypothetical protein
MASDFIASVQPRNTATNADSDGMDATAQSDETGWVQIYHGTDLDSANRLKNDGVSHAEMQAYYEASSDFCTTPSIRTAVMYSTLNIAVQMNGATPAVFGAKLPVRVVQELKNNNLVKEIPEDPAMEFSPAAFESINAAMSDKEVTLTADIRFDE